MNPLTHLQTRDSAGLQRAIALQPGETLSDPFQSFVRAVTQGGNRLRTRMQSLLKPLLKQKTRKLQLLDMQQLGEKRFVAIVQVGEQSFLIGGASSSVSLLAELGDKRAYAATPRAPGPESA
jgi:hypothetical protein